MKSARINNGLKGEVCIPGDKSISHRSVIIPSISSGVSEIKNILQSDDVLNTINAFKNMGVKIETKEDSIIIHGNGLNSLTKPSNKIYLGNSGTSARLLSGLLANQNFETILEGDKSLSSRPMKRIIEPLEKMGAKISSNNGMLPIIIKGKKLNCIKYEIPIPSAQIKSGIILAALNTEGITEIIEADITRDHTEIMLKSFGANIDIEEKNKTKLIKIKGQQELNAKNITVPSDLSSSAFFIVAALINENSLINMKNININPTRSGILNALNLMGANIKIENKKFINEELVADIEVKTSSLNGCELNSDMAKLMIDEYPILSIAASFANSPSIFRGLKELRVKESDRLELIKINLINCGVRCKVINDDLFIYPSKKYSIKKNIIRTDYDHRIAMSFAIMGTKLDEEIIIQDSESINTSFPKFIKKFNLIGGKIIE